MLYGFKSSQWMRPFIVAGCLLAISLLPSWAAQTEITQWTLDPTDQITLTVSGEGFDPLFTIQKLTNGQSQISIIANDVHLNSSARNSFLALKEALKHSALSITNVDCIESGNQIRLLLTSNQALHPQIKSNTGAQIQLVFAKAASSEKNNEQYAMPAVSSKNETPETIEVSFDTRLQQRQRQIDAQRALIRSQENSWQASQQKIALNPVNLADAVPTTPTSDSIDAPGSTQAKDDRSSSLPIQLSTTPDELLKGNTQTLYRRVNPEQSLESLFQNPNTSSTIKEAIQLDKQGKTEQAIQTLKTYQTSNSADLDLHFVLGNLWKKQALLQTGVAQDEALNQARTHLFQDVQQRPSLSAYFALADMALTANQLSEAERWLDQMQLLSPEHPQLFFLRGRLSEAQSFWKEAQQYYRTVLAKMPSFYEAHYRLAQIALKTTQWNDAEWELLQVLQAIPDDNRALKLLGFIAQQQHNPELALQFYQKALQPDVILSYARLTAKQSPSSKKALALLAAVEPFTENNPDLLFNLGMTYIDLHYTAQAKTILGRFIELNPNDKRVSQARSALQQSHR